MTDNTITERPAPRYAATVRSVCGRVGGVSGDHAGAVILSMDEFVENRRADGYAFDGWTLTDRVTGESTAMPTGEV